MEGERLTMAEESALRELSCFEVTQDGELLPVGAWVWVDWSSQELEAGRVVMARVDGVVRLGQLQQEESSVWSMKQADGRAWPMSDVQEFGRCRAWRPRGHEL